MSDNKIYEIARMINNSSPLNEDVVNALEVLRNNFQNLLLNNDRKKDREEYLHSVRTPGLKERPSPVQADDGRYNYLSNDANEFRISTYTDNVPEYLL